jgi:hypothetical protein
MLMGYEFAKIDNSVINLTTLKTFNLYDEVFNNVSTM